MDQVLCCLTRVIRLALGVLFLQLRPLLDVVLDVELGEQGEHEQVLDDECTADPRVDLAVRNERDELVAHVDSELHLRSGQRADKQR